MSSLDGVHYVFQPNIWSHAKIAAVSTTLAVALTAIGAGIFLGGAGGINIAMFSGGGALLFIDATVCIHSCWRLRQFYQAVKVHDLHYPSERFELKERAFDYRPFAIDGRPYIVMYVKDGGIYSALFFFDGDYFGKRMLEIWDTHDWVRPE